MRKSVQKVLKSWNTNLNKHWYSIWYFLHSAVFTFNKIDLKLEKIIFRSFIDRIAFTLFTFSPFSSSSEFMFNNFLCSLHQYNNYIDIIATASLKISYRANTIIYTFSLIDSMLLLLVFIFPFVYFFLRACFAPFLIFLSLFILRRQYPLLRDFKPAVPVLLLPIGLAFTFHQNLFICVIFCQI